MNAIDEMILETVEDTIERRIARAMRLEMSADVVYELLSTRKDLLVDFSLTNDVRKDDATEEETKEAKTHEDDASKFTGEMAEYRGKRYPIYNDDYGQCDDVYMNGQFYSMGTYNFFETYKSDIGYLAEDNYNSEKMAELFGPDWVTLLTK